MPTLELVVDATGVQRGAQQAEAALRGVATAADQTAAKVQVTGQSLSKTFQATQGGVQIATGIAQTAQAFQSLNTAAAGFVGARTLLEIGQTAQQLALLRGGAAGASGAMLLLGRSIPYVGLALSAGAALYAIFGNRVQDTTKKINEQVDALSRLQSKLGETSIRASYGQPDPRLTAGGTVDALVALRQSDRETLSASQAAALFGVSEQDLRYALARSGLGESALEYAPGRAELRDPTTGRLIYSPSERFRLQSFTRQQVIGAGENILGQRRLQESGIDPLTGGALGGNYNVPLPPPQEAQQALVEPMSQAAQYAQQIASSLGGAVFDVAAGVVSLRQALAQLVGQFARQGLSDLGSSLAANLFRPTSAQATGLSNPHATPVQ